MRNEEFLAVIPGDTCAIGTLERDLRRPRELAPHQRSALKIAARVSGRLDPIGAQFGCNVSCCNQFFMGRAATPTHSIGGEEFHVRANAGGTDSNRSDPHLSMNAEGAPYQDRYQEKTNSKILHGPFKQASRSTQPENQRASFRLRSYLIAAISSVGCCTHWYTGEL